MIVKYLEIATSIENIHTNNLLGLNVSQFNEDFSIVQSDWIQNFSSKLGIGNFLLLELKIPDEKNVPPHWIELYERLCDNLKDMEATIRKGEWQETMRLARPFFENIKIGDKKPEHANYKEEFSQILRNQLHFDESIQNFYDGVFHFFDFTSKYVHDKNKDGKLNPKIIASKEDAYFLYSMAIGLCNFIGSKISR